MDINQLLYFQKVAELQHMTKAAEELNISQAALSQPYAVSSGSWACSFLNGWDATSPSAPTDRCI